MAVPVNPTTVTVSLSSTSGGAALPVDETVTGAAVLFAPATLDASGNPVAPPASAFVVNAPVSAADFGRAVNGQISFPLSDLAVNLADGLWAAVATETATLGTLTATSAFSATPAFFTVAPVAPATPDAPTITIA